MGLLACLKEKLNLAQRRDAGEVVSRFKDMTKFLSDAYDAAKDNDILKGIAKALPWADVGKAAVQTLPVLKFVSTLIEKWTEVTDPDELGYLACTLAYQRSVEQAIQALDWKAKPAAASEPLKQSLDQKLSDLADFSTFSFETALQHRFVMEADDALTTFANGFNPTNDETRKLLGEVHTQFVPNLKEILATSEKFQNFKERIALGTAETRAARTLALHADYQAWQFEKRPLFGREPFSLQDIYVEMECGELSWGQIRKSRSREQGPNPQALDPFVEKNGGRHSLLQTVLQSMADPGFNDAIVVQGVAGSGKSTFTLRLCATLLERGLRPIRIRLNDLALDENLDIQRALSRALKFYDPAREHGTTGDLAAHGEDLFQGNAIFRDPITFSHGNQEATISRYVLILDAWDELTVGVSGNLHDRVERVLRQVRREFLTGQPPTIRVILTGRPSTAVEESDFLYDPTRILTIRPLNPVSLRDLVGKLGRVLVCPIDGSLGGPVSFDAAKFDGVFKTYEEGHERVKESATVASDWGPLGVLGLPLLTQLVVRLVLAEQVDAQSLISDTTTLYRRLVDLTCAEAGQPQAEAMLVGDVPRFRGWELRHFLRHTASAITASGRESISRLELTHRLQKLETSRDLKDKLLIRSEPARKTEQSPLANLLVSYYFQTGHHQSGCEFAHKSFREYLFAEAIVEELKEHARDARIRDRAGDRGDFWMDFAESDRRWRLSRRLGLLLAPIWLSPEIENHVHNLIAWEVARKPGEEGSKVAGFTVMLTEPITLDGWIQLRDDLADLWEWWGEGVHLRPQIRLEAGNIKGFERSPYAVDLIEWSLPKDFDREGDQPPPPPRTVTVDAHLGVGLFLLNVVTHCEVARYRAKVATEAKADLQEPQSAQGKALEDPRPYQSARPMAWGSEVRFLPSSRKSYLKNYIARINAAGWRPRGEFPVGADLVGADLRGADLSRTQLREADLREADLREANLRGADLVGADLRGADLSGADLSGAQLSGADLSRAHLSEADLVGADLVGADLRGADLLRAHLRRADLLRADLSGADLSGADLSGAQLSEANLSEANLREANLRGADLSRAQLREANLSGVDLRVADLSRANLREANLRGADLSGANLREAADLRGADLREASGLTKV